MQVKGISQFARIIERSYHARIIIASKLQDPKIVLSQYSGLVQTEKKPISCRKTKKKHGLTEGIAYELKHYLYCHFILR